MCYRLIMSVCIITTFIQCMEERPVEIFNLHDVFEETLQDCIDENKKNGINFDDLTREVIELKFYGRVKKEGQTTLNPMALIFQNNMHAGLYRVEHGDLSDMNSFEKEVFRRYFIKLGADQTFVKQTAQFIKLHGDNLLMAAHAAFTKGPAAYAAILYSLSENNLIEMFGPSANDAIYKKLLINQNCKVY